MLDFLLIVPAVLSFKLTVITSIKKLPSPISNKTHICSIIVNQALHEEDMSYDGVCLPINEALRGEKHAQE